MNTWKARIKKMKLNKTMLEIIKNIQFSSNEAKKDLGVGKRYLSAARKLKDLGLATYEITPQGFIVVQLLK